MNRLECQVTNCQHYQNNHCSLAGIQVDCASFEERRPGSAQNAACSKPAVETDIQCKVKGCTYNSHNRCSAQSVCVDACCGDVSSKSGTQCRTFQNK